MESTFSGEMNGPDSWNLNNLDMELKDATLTFLQTGNLTPLIKHELRCKIQSQRMAAGKEELSVSFEPPEHHQMTPSEIEKRRLQREKNKVAAQKCRQKKRKRLETITEECKRQEMLNNELKEKIRKMDEVKAHCQEILKRKDDPE